MSDSTGSVLVTGAAGGIGAATVAALAGRGYRVFAGVRSADQAAAFDGAARVHPVVLDVTEPDSVRTALGQVAERASGLSALVNNAGVIVQGPLELLSAAELHRQFAVNVFGAVAVAQASLDLLRVGTGGRPGRLVNISAPTAKLAVPYLGPISASKAALEALNDALRVELAPWGVPVTAVRPGASDTGIFGKADAASRRDRARLPADRQGLYASAIAAIEKATANQSYTPAREIAAVVVRAVTDRRPRPYYSAGRGVGLLLALSGLPARLRDRLIKQSFGLNGVTAPAADPAGSRP
ncbi:SDR family NAD(P)-dependent oxidoreductase [Allonocardiopsis opalescens]|uniref:Short-subunit dehydrogenase n=1 Tax=Allonocardiopsis opalescens TaxID=1144618 RepID=A0A2T0QCF2_9ACTN|nr:SDR family NAD(P)-dependent oxidoreductase [Allonocardiopsis opalescens]PRY01550.1 short-subunit dehydrogenase [Allonocardiopsis opalescens]